MLPNHSAITDIIEHSPKREAHYYASQFANQSRGDSDGWILLRDIFNFHFKSDNAKEPFSAMFIDGDRRSMIPHDLTSEQLDELESTLSAVVDSEYRARIGDLLWICRRDASAARDASQHYLKSAAQIEQLDAWPPAMERYERSIRLARQIDPNGELFLSHLKHLKERVYHHEGKDKSYFTLKCLELLCEFRCGDNHRLAQIARNVALGARDSGDYRRARSYFDIEAALHRNRKDQPAREKSLTESAECFVAEAEAREAAGDALAARSFWEDAIIAFRERENLRSRIPDLQRRLSEAGQAARGAMKSLSHEINIEQQVTSTIARFQDLRADDALAHLALFLGPLDYEQILNDVKAEIAENPLQSLIDSHIFDEAGRKIAKRPALPMRGDIPDSMYEGFVLARARHLYELTSVAYLAPAIRTILADHDVPTSTIKRIVELSAFVPEDRRSLFIKAIEAGFNWDFSTALHIAVPQLENSLRYLLIKNGVVPRTVNKDGIEDVWLLDRSLEHPTTVEALGEDLTRELQSLLSGRLGPNIRNCIAHGLLSEKALNGPVAFYTWWTIYRIVALFSDELKDFVERNNK